MIAQFKPVYDRWLQAIIVGVPTVTFTLAVAYLAKGEWDTGAALLGIVLFVALVYWSVFPRAYVILPDRLRIVLGWPWSLSLHFGNIEEIRPGRFIDVLAYSGLRLAPSVRTPVQVKRNRGLNVVISPADREGFLEAAQSALDAYRTGFGG